MLRHIALVAAGLSAALLLAPAGAVLTPAQAAVGVAVDIGPDRAPPRLRAEIRPRRPHRGAVWQRGHWAWRDGRYDWVGGVWVDPPRARAAWIPGHWNRRGRNWVWIEGHWA